MGDKEKVLKVMHEAGKALKAGEIAELGGLEKTVVDKVMKELKKDEEIISPKRCYWEPK
ncbi:MAG: MarR family transcriptional regulator [Candidatus Cloacimonetes bacterium]|nr:MarR family transcriptional regulator [Candidatus Cloacimonadota bacterium]